MLTCVVKAHWCFHGNGGAAWAVAPPEREGQQRAAFKKNTQIKLLQNENIMLVSEVYSHTYSRSFALKKIYIYIYFAAKYECIELSVQQRHLDLVGQCPPPPPLPLM